MSFSNAGASSVKDIFQLYTKKTIRRK